MISPMPKGAITPSSVVILCIVIDVVCKLGSTESSYTKLSLSSIILSKSSIKSANVSCASSSLEMYARTEINKTLHLNPPG